MNHNPPSHFETDETRYIRQFLSSFRYNGTSRVEHALRVFSSSAQSPAGSPPSFQSQLPNRSPPQDDTHGVYSRSFFEGLIGVLFGIRLGGLGIVECEACKVEIRPIGSRIEPQEHYRPKPQCDGVRTLSYFSKDNICVSGHQIVCPEKHCSPGTKCGRFCVAADQPYLHRSYTTECSLSCSAE